VNGAAGGWANAQASSSGTSGNANVSVRAIAVGGNGGQGNEGPSDPSTVVSGAGGLAFATASGRSSGTGTVTVEADQTGGNGGSGGGAAIGGTGAASTMNNAVKGWTNGGTLHLIQSSTGGSAGPSSSSKPGAGGAATAALLFDDTVNFTQSKSLVAESTARGGDGGNSGNGDNFFNPGLISGNGANGASATATETIKGSGDVDVIATAIGGHGGFGTGSSSDPNAAFHGGTGGTAVATARGVSTGSGTVSVTATQQGGNGGDGTVDINFLVPGAFASAGAGADSIMTNAVSGMTNGGTLSLHETALGGGGGDTIPEFGDGGHGGTAVASLHFDDLLNATQSKAVDASVTAAGGTGGVGQFALGGDGGNATASDTIIAKYHAAANADAAGGDSGLGDPGHNARGGDATATAVATATDASSGDVSANATAHGGKGLVFIGTVGSATATATGTGHSGSVLANADTHGDPTFGAGPNPFQLQSFFGAGADAIVVAGQSTAQAQVSVSDNAPDHVVGPQAVALLVGDPSAASQNAELTADPNLRSYFHDDTFYFASGELGAASSPGNASAAYTQSSHVALDINTSGFNTPTPAHDLILGFYDPTVTGGASGPVNLDVTDNGTSLLHVSFASTTQAASYLQDHPVDLGSLSVQQVHNLNVALSVTENPGQHAGLYVDLVFGSGHLLV
jgi:hypothetical protein